MNLLCKLIDDFKKYVLSDERGVVTINFYDLAIMDGLEGNADYDTDTFTAELYNSTHVFTAANTQRSDVSANALSTGNGYTNPGQDLVSNALTQPVAGTTQWDANDVSWTASGGSIGPADDCVIYNQTETTPVDSLVCSIDFGASETAGSGTDFKITFHANGIFRIS